MAKKCRKLTSSEKAEWEKISKLPTDEIEAARAAFVKKIMAPGKKLFPKSMIEFTTGRVPISEGGGLVPPSQTIPKGVVDNTRIVNEIGAKERVRPTRHVFEKMGLYTVYKGIQTAEVELGEARIAFQKELKKTSKLVSKERRYLVFRELENPGSIKELTFNEKRAVTWFKTYFDKWADTLGLVGKGRIKNYVTHIFEKDIELQLRNDGLLDPATSVTLETTPETIFNPFLQERLGKELGLIEDPFAAASAYESRQLRVLYYEPMLQKIASIANNPKTPSNAGNYLRDYSRRMTNEPSKIDKEINRTLQEFASKIYKLPGGKTLATYLSRGNPSGMAAYNFTSALYTLWLGFKPTSAIRNLSQHTLIIGEVGPLHFANGLRLRLTTEGRAALKKSLVWRSRKMAFLPGIDDSFQSRWVDKFRETALWMFRKADAQNVMDAFLAGYSEAKSLLPNADEQVWVERGDEVAADTQYIYTKMNSFALSQNSIGRVFSVLTTWSVNWMELMTKWVSRRPSYVYQEQEALTGEKIKGANWSTSYKAVLLYMTIVGLGYALKERERLKAWEYTGITSVRYIADIIGGDFPGLEAPGAIADLIVGFLTDDERMLKMGLAALKNTLTPAIYKQVNSVASGEKDWLTLFFYLEGRDYKLAKLKDKWEKDYKDYPLFETDEDWAEFQGKHPEYRGWSQSQVRSDWREKNPKLEAKMFVVNELGTLSSDKARTEVLKLIEENDIDVSLIDAYDKVFGTDTRTELDTLQNRIGSYEDLKAGEEPKYFTTSNFASEVNSFVKGMGRDKVTSDGSKLAIAYLEAKDAWSIYDNFEDSDARIAFRHQFPEVEAMMYMFGKVSAFQNPRSAEILLGLMNKYNIKPEGIPAFLDKPERYDELFQPIFKLELRTYERDLEYEAIEYDDEKKQKDERAQYLEDNPDYRDDRRRILAYKAGVPSKFIENYVAYFALPAGKARTNYRVANSDFSAMLEDDEIWGEGALKPTGGGGGVGGGATREEVEARLG